jgi:signal transduction histidine kinase
MTDAASRQEPARVLIVDDDEGSLRLARKSLERAGCIVFASAAVAAASERIARDRPDLLVFGHPLEGAETGLDFFRRLRREGVGLPAIMVTSLAEGSRVIEALRAGVSEVVPKSGDYLAYLPEAVERVLAPIRLQRVLQSQREVLEERDRLLAAEQSARQVAEEANRAKDCFLAMLSHELRTPLTPVLAGTRGLESMPGLPEAAQASVRMIRRNIELEARLIDDLLDLTRVANGKLRLSLETVDVHEVIDSVLGLFGSEIAVKQQEVHVEKMSENHHVMADRARLQQMLWNLVRNASKFTPEGGHIYVRTRDARMQIEISIEDTGIGIAPDQIGKLFNAFEQGSQRMTQQFGGLGLGLAITKALTDAHGGTVSAQSPGPHCGATFTILLPTVTAPATEPVAVPAVGAGADERLSILLVEDHVDTAEVMAQLMRGLGHDVTIASCVSDALAATHARPFDLIVSDIGLPDGTGIDFIGAFRQRSQVPAVALTGFGTEEDVRRCLAAGFNSHLTKPINFVQLETLIRHAADGKSRGEGARAAHA